MKLEEHVSLSLLTTFHIGGRARYFCRVHSVDELAQAASFAKKGKLPVLILGGGSNILIPDEGFEGFVVKIDILGIEFSEGKKKNVQVTAGAGESWDGLVAHTVEKGLWGLENLSGIPGLVGGAPIQNIGAYGTELSDVLESVQVFDLKTLSLRLLSRHECTFGYRDSMFKHVGKHLVVTKIVCILSQTGHANIGYKDLKEYFSEKKTKVLSSKEVRAAVISIRSKKFPDLNEVGTAGSFFKNPIVSNATYQRIKKSYSDIPAYEAGPGKMKLSLAWILDHICNAKGIRVGDAGVSGKQALVLCNFGSASAADVRSLAERITTMVREKVGIEIEPEVRIM